MKKRGIELAKKRMNKKGQVMGMPFQMIFSIILAIVFLTIGFIAIRYVLDMQKNSQAALFVSEFRNKVTDLWQKSIADYNFTAVLPKQVQYVCFADLSFANTTAMYGKIWDDISGFKGKNMFFWPMEEIKVSALNIENLNIQDLPTNPYCLSNAKGKVSIHLVKNSDEALVRIIP